MESGSRRKYDPTRIPSTQFNDEGMCYWKRTGGVRILGLSCYLQDRLPIEQFYYHHLILSRPFRGMLDLIDRNNNDEGTYERQCQLEEVVGDDTTTTQGILAALNTDLLRQKVRLHVNAECFHSRGRVSGGRGRVVLFPALRPPLDIRLGTHDPSFSITAFPPASVCLART